MVKEKKNPVIELWKFIIVIAIIGFNINYVLTNPSNEFYIKQSMWFLGAKNALIMIPIIIGYLIVNYYKKNEKENSKSSSEKAIKFIIPFIKKVIPLLVIGYILGILIGTKFFYSSYTIKDILSMVANNIWGLFGLLSVGLSSTNGELYVLNSPLTFISSILVVSYFIYYGLCKNEDLFRGFISLILIIMLTTMFKVLLNNITIFTIYGMLIGVVLYYVADKLKSVRLTKQKKVMLTMLNMFCSLLLIWYTFYKTTIFGLEFYSVLLLSVIIIIISFIEKDYLTKLINNDHSTKIVFNYLGELSLYMYIIHYPVAILVLRIFGPNSALSTYSIFEIYVPTLLITISLSAFIKNIINSIKNI